MAHSPDDSFTPRREFIRDHKPFVNSFSLLSISRSNLIRLYSFPQPVITTIRQFLEQCTMLTGFREDLTANYCELSLQGKPWSNPKSVASEALLLSIISILYHHGHSYLSTIDYGREQDDRLFMAFQRATTQTSTSPPGSARTGSPAPPSSDQIHLTTPPVSKRVPFALSFPSATVLRVINPPLHSTPAILQAVRSSWPRGVVSEKKIGDVAFEFRLKGYRWYQEDTFATDSLSHILSLLTSLDSHSFTLLTSASLTNRSRVKDLWIFTGPAPTSDQILETPPSSTHNSPRVNGKHTPELAFSHQRLATAPPPSPPHLTPIHSRAATTDAVARPGPTSPLSSPPQTALPSSPGLLRKPAPRAQVPVSVVNDDETEEFPLRPDDHQYRAVHVPPEQLRENLPSEIPEGVENMTGVGSPSKTPEVFYSSSPFFVANTSTEKRPERDPAAYGTTTPPLVHSPHSGTESYSTPPSPLQERGPARLLSPDAFRDTAFSESSEGSARNSHTDTPLPVMWKGKAPEVDTHPEDEAAAPTRRPEPPKLQERHSSTGPMLPGAWAPTPIQETPNFEDAPEHQGELQPETPEQGQGPTTPVHELTNRVASPEMKQVDAGNARKSESGLLMMASSPATAEASDHEPLGKNVSEQAETTENGGTPPRTSATASGKGWVIVDIEGKQEPKQDLQASPTEIDRAGEAVPIGSPAIEPPLVVPTPVQVSSQSEAVVKHIAAVDAVDAVHKKSKSKDGIVSTPVSGFSTSSNSSIGTESPKKGRVRRFFSLSKKSKGDKSRTRTGSGFQSSLQNVGEHD